jgi:hypothetical protein
MAWRSSTWVRWLGWTVLYAVLFYVGLFDIFNVLPDWIPGAQWLLFLAPAFIAFVIGVRFRSWSWGLGPLAATIVPSVLLYVRAWLGGAIPEALGLIGVGILGSAVIGGVSALAALAGVWLGVWWEERQE